MWLYQEKDLEHEISNEYYGFVYLIQNTISGKSSTKQVKGKRKKIRKDSGWQDYWGSSTKLLEEIEKLGKENFKRTIIRLCKTRGECNYWEAKLQFEQDVLCAVMQNDEPAYYNDNIMMKFTRRNIGK